MSYIMQANPDILVIADAKGIHELDISSIDMNTVTDSNAMPRSGSVPALDHLAVLQARGSHSPRLSSPKVKPLLKPAYVS